MRVVWCVRHCDIGQQEAELCELGMAAKRL